MIVFWVHHGNHDTFKYPSRKFTWSKLGHHCACRCPSTVGARASAGTVMTATLTTIILNRLWELIISIQFSDIWKIKDAARYPSTSRIIIDEAASIIVGLGCTHFHELRILATVSHLFIHWDRIKMTAVSPKIFCWNKIAVSLSKFRWSLLPRLR